MKRKEERRDEHERPLQDIGITKQQENRLKPDLTRFLHLALQITDILAEIQVNAAHPLIQAIDTLVKKGEQVHTITLPPLGPAEVNRLIADALHCSPGTTSSLSRLCLKKTGGNPFMALGIGKNRASRDY